MITSDNVYCIGQLGKTHGLRGELTLSLDDEAYILDVGMCLFLLLDGCYIPFFIDECHYKSGTRVFVKLSSIDTIEQAVALVNAEVYLEKINSVATTETLSPYEVVGFAIYDSTSKTTTAAIAHIDTSTDNPLFVLSDGTLIPIAKEWIAAIDVSKRIIRMTLPEGLLTL